MQNLHGNFSACGMHTVGDDLMVGDIGFCIKPCCTRKDAPLFIGRNPTRNHQCSTAPRTLRIKLGNTIPVFGFLKIGVHRAHNHTIFQSGMAQIKRGEHMWILRHGKTPRWSKPEAKRASSHPKRRVNLSAC